MAMTTCSECKKEISSTASACPNCGAKPPKSKTWIWILLAIPVAFLAFGFSVSSTPQGKAESSARNAISMCWDSQEKKSNSAADARFIAGACEHMEQNFIEKFGHKP